MVSIQQGVTTHILMFQTHAPVSHHQHQKTKIPYSKIDCLSRYSRKMSGVLGRYHNSCLAPFSCFQFSSTVPTPNLLQPSSSSTSTSMSLQIPKTTIPVPSLYRPIHSEDDDYDA